MLYGVVSYTPMLIYLALTLSSSSLFPFPLPLPSPPSLFPLPRVVAHPKSATAIRMGKETFYRQLEAPSLGEAYEIAGQSMVDNMRQVGFRNRIRWNGRMNDIDLKVEQHAQGTRHTEDRPCTGYSTYRR